jgi:hypothetical protein
MRKCQENGVNTSLIDQSLTLLNNEEPLAYLFGISVTKENPLSRVNIWILTKSTLVDIDFRGDNLVTVLLKLSSIKKVTFQTSSSHITVRLSTGVSSDLYLHNYLHDLFKVREFMSNFLRVLSTF